MKKIKKFAVAGVGFGDIIILIEDILKNDKSLKFLGFIDDKKNKNINLKNYKIIGSWKGMKNKNIHIFNSVAKNNFSRIQAFKKLKSYGYKFLNLIHPSIDLNYSKIGSGICIFNNVFIGTNVSIGSQTIIHSFSSIGHDVSIGKNCFIAPGAKILGGVKIKDNVFIGANSVCLPKTIINSKSVVGAGSTVAGIIKSRSTMFSGLGKKIN